MADAVHRGGTMPSTPDILIFSPDRQLEAVVEVKNRRNAGEEWAIQFRRNLLAHGLIPAVEYFLLVFPDTVYLWRGKEAERPAASIPTPEALGRFFDVLPTDSSSESSLELVVSSWLQTLTASMTEEEIAEVAKWLVDAGLYERIRGGHVERRPAA